MNGWIKIYRIVRNNEIYQRDPTAWRIFFHLLLSADKNGECTFGRRQLANQLGLKESTTYVALRRLARSKMVIQRSNNQFTRFTICKWKEYQQPSNNEVTTKSQPSNNEVTHFKNKEVRIKKDNIVEIQNIYDLFISSFNRDSSKYKLTDARKAKIKARLMDAGKEMLESAIIRTSQNSFYLGDNSRHWKADLDFIIRSYEQVEKLSQLASDRPITIKESTEEWIPV